MCVYSLFSSALASTRELGAWLRITRRPSDGSIVQGHTSNPLLRAFGGVRWALFRREQYKKKNIMDHSTEPRAKFNLIHPPHHRPHCKFSKRDCIREWHWGCNISETGAGFYWKNWFSLHFCADQFRRRDPFIAGFIFCGKSTNGKIFRFFNAQFDEIKLNLSFMIWWKLDWIL